MIKYAVGVLALVNVVAWLWGIDYGSRDPVPEGFRAKPEVNLGSMRLIEEGQGQSQAGTASGGTCFRVGPFVERAAFESAVGAVRARGLGLDEIEVDARKVRAYRVYLGPFRADQTAGVEQQLQSAGISESYLFREEDGSQTMSLGLFSQLKTAEKFVSDVAGKGVVARIRPELRTLAANFWIETAPVSATGHANWLTLQTWSDKLATVRRISCQDRGSLGT